MFTKEEIIMVTMEYSVAHDEINTKKFIRELEQIMLDKNYRPEPGRKGVHINHVSNQGPGGQFPGQGQVQGQMPQGYGRSPLLTSNGTSAEISGSRPKPDHPI